METWRKDAIGMTILALVIWVVFIIVWCEAAWSAAQHLSGTDWRANHRTKQNLLLAALAVLGLPPLGAVLGWVWGPIGGASKRPAWYTAAGFLLGALGLVVIAAICYAVVVYRTLETL